MATMEENIKTHMALNLLNYLILMLIYLGPNIFHTVMVLYGLTMKQYKIQRFSAEKNQEDYIFR